jgi:hypothetical protein
VEGRSSDSSCVLPDLNCQVDERCYDRDATEQLSEVRKLRQSHSCAPNGSAFSGQQQR